MSGIFGVVSKENCIEDLFYRTDYHFHLGTAFGGMAVLDGKDINYLIKEISSHPFRSQMSDFKNQSKANSGIGVISDYEVQPLSVYSPFGNYALVHVGRLNNLKQLSKGKSFLEMSSGGINPVEVISGLINQGKDFADGIETAQNSIEGSSSLMLLSKEGIYVARDKYGRTPIFIGKKQGARAATFESSTFPNLGFEVDCYLGHGEIGIIHSEGYQMLKKPEDKMQICSFLWIYFGFPASSYGGINAENTRLKFGKFLADN